LLFETDWLLRGIQSTPQDFAGVSPAINNHYMCSSEGPPWSLIGGWLLQTPFFIIAIVLVGYDDKKTNVSTSSEMMSQ